MGIFDGRVALVTGAARGQGRSHALAFAREGADVVCVDMCRQLASVEYQLARPADLDETVRAVEELDRRALAVTADVREPEEIEDAVHRGLAEFGRLDFAVANAGIMPTTGEPATAMQAWRDAVDTMLSGVFYTVHAVVPTMVEQRSGSVVLIGSTSSHKPVSHDLPLLNPGQLGYGAAKHGILSLVRNYAMGLGPYGVRVNCVHPMGVRTPMVINEPFRRHKERMPPGWGANMLRADLAEPQDISEAVVWLCSDKARLVTGVELPVDAGTLAL